MGVCGEGGGGGVGLDIQSYLNDTHTSVAR